MFNILLIEPNNAAYDETALEGPLGGSETVFLFMVRALKTRDDCTVDVFFKDSGDLAKFVAGKNYDLVISYRFGEPLYHVRGRVNVVFFQDLPSDLAIVSLKALIERGRIDRLIFLSHFQKLQYLPHLLAIQEGRQCLMLDNPFDMALFDSSIEKENAFIYASAPNRGLDVLLNMWPRIYQELPNYKLKIAGSVKMYNVPGNKPEANQGREEFLGIGKELYDQDIPGVEWLGGLSHTELLKEFESSKALLYPCTFAETSCHVLNCALHAGCSPFVSQAGALVEKVCDGENGVIIPGDPQSPAFQDMYVRAIVEMVKSGSLDRMNRTNRGEYAGWGYQRVFERMLSRLLKHEKIEGENQKIFGVCCSLRGNNHRNFRNIKWYAPYDMQVDEIVGKPIDQARNMAGSLAVHKKANWLLLLDDDVYVHRSFLIEMMKRALDNNVGVVVANYMYQTDDALVSVSRLVRRSDNRAIDCSTISEEDANSKEYKFITSGLGACLISTKVLKQIGRPYFRTQTVNPKHCGEDAYFFQECQALGIKVWLALDIPTIHVSEEKCYGKPEHIKTVLSSILPA